MEIKLHKKRYGKIPDKSFATKIIYLGSLSESDYYLYTYLGGYHYLFKKSYITSDMNCSMFLSNALLSNDKIIKMAAEKAQRYLLLK